MDGSAEQMGRAEVMGNNGIGEKLEALMFWRMLSRFSTSHSLSTPPSPSLLALSVAGVCSALNGRNEQKPPKPKSVAPG